MVDTSSAVTPKQMAGWIKETWDVYRKSQTCDYAEAVTQTSCPKEWQPIVARAASNATPAITRWWKAYR